MLAFVHIDVLHQARHVGRDHQLGGLHIGIVGGDVASARQTADQRKRQHDRDAADHQDAAQRCAVGRDAPGQIAKLRKGTTVEVGEAGWYRFASQTFEFYSPAIASLDAGQCLGRQFVFDTTSSASTSTVRRSASSPSDHVRHS